MKKSGRSEKEAEKGMPVPWNETRKQA